MGFLLNPATLPRRDFHTKLWMAGKQLAYFHKSARPLPCLLNGKSHLLLMWFKFWLNFWRPSVGGLLFCPHSFCILPLPLAACTQTTAQATLSFLFVVFFIAGKVKWALSMHYFVTVVIRKVNRLSLKMIHYIQCSCCTIAKTRAWALEWTALAVAHYQLGKWNKRI